MNYGHLYESWFLGHSEGGIMPRWYFKFLGGDKKVEKHISLAPANHGTTLDGIGTLGKLIGIQPLTNTVCPSCFEFVIGSDFLAKLNDGGDTIPGIKYSVLATETDEAVTPYTSCFLTGPNVVNTKLQDICPLDLSEHLLLAVDHNVFNWILNQLDPANAKPFHCLLAPTSSQMPTPNTQNLTQYL